MTDSDELVVFEMSRGDDVLTTTVAGPMSSWRAAKLLSRCDAHQTSYWPVSIRLHAGDVGPAWNRTEQAATRFAQRVMWLRPLALWTYLASRRVRPVKRKAGELKKRLRRASKDVRRVIRRARLAH